MKTFLVTARTVEGDQQFACLAASSGEAAERVANLYDEPCGITVHREAA